MKGKGMKVMPLVSIAVITYNQIKFLRECLESILNQDYENIEIVVADDGSDDGTQAMLKNYAGNFPGKFKLCLSDKNKGITANSNAALFSCAGKYIAFMGGDDLMLPGKLSRQVEFMEKNGNCAISYHDLDVFNGETGQTIYLFSQKNKPRQGGIEKLVKYGCFNGACSTMIRREYMPLHGFNELLPVASDWFFNIECLNKSGEIKYIDEVLGRYRRHEKNITNKGNGLKITQNDIDSLNACNFIVSIRPDLFGDAMHGFSLIIRKNRHHLPYVKALLFRMKFAIDIKCIFALFVLMISAGKIRL